MRNVRKPVSRHFCPFFPEPAGLPSQVEAFRDQKFVELRWRMFIKKFLWCWHEALRNKNISIKYKRGRVVNFLLLLNTRKYFVDLTNKRRKVNDPKQKGRHQLVINWDEAGKRIKELRTAHKLSLRALAEKLDVSHTAVAEWEKGAVYPNKRNVNALCEVFNVQPSFILTGVQIKDTDGQRLVNQIDLLSDKDKQLVSSIVDRLLTEQPKTNGRKK